ncbi:hypothetical protein BDV33DRAFT_73206 [Aspergillus novoparasiticus]|uniref:Uncharacterized protein n=1 Tax=Aspergillus novoparasiticus TaxID=986946 RepID=A0A5N6E7D9_9EURO|nr:hypothetical protein BDV33DRAFT_73206 [Aspergillus novoparasiticus]
MWLPIMLAPKMALCSSMRPADTHLDRRLGVRFASFSWSRFPFHEIPIASFPAIFQPPYRSLNTNRRNASVLYLVFGGGSPLAWLVLGLYRPLFCRVIPLNRPQNGPIGGIDYGYIRTSRVTGTEITTVGGYAGSTTTLRDVFSKSIENLQAYHFDLGVSRSQVFYAIITTAISLYGCH